MLILCSGPDTFHARKKARELVAAFRQKHDPTGYSTEMIDSSVGAQRAVPLLLAKIGAPSLFASKRMIRCDGLLDMLKIVEVRQLAKRLAGDQESTIILSVEHEPPAEKVLKEFVGIKLVHYHAHLLTGAKFVAAVIQRAREMSVSESLAREVAKRTDGDMWLAEQELQKAFAHPHTEFVQAMNESGTVFDSADAYLVQRVGWRERVASFPDESMVSILATQSRTFARVRDGETMGVHPYVARKFSSIKLSDVDARRRFLGTLRSLYAARQFATEEESQTLL